MFFSSVSSHLEKIKVNLEKQQKRVPLIWDGSHLKLDGFLAVCYHKNNNKTKISPECGFQLRIKVIALANHKGQRQSTEPIKTHENVWEREACGVSFSKQKKINESKWNIIA